MDRQRLVGVLKLVGGMVLITGVLVGGLFYVVGFNTYDRVTTVKPCNELARTDTATDVARQVTPLALSVGDTSAGQRPGADWEMRPNRSVVPDPANPILTPSQDWEGPNVKHPGLFYDDGTYYLFYHSGKGTERGRQIGVATSEDRNFSTWEKSAANPILENSETGWDADTVGHPEVIEVPNAASGYRYHMFYWGKNETWQLGHAMSNDLIHWRKDPANPILTNGDGWDSCRLESPSVVKTDDGFALLYHGAANTTFSIGLARSTNADLSTWTKSPANPVLVAQSGSEGFEVHAAAFQKDLHANETYTNAIPDLNDGRYVIQYAANSRRTLNTAVSRTLTNWTRYRGNPILDTENLPGIQRVSDPDVYNISGELHMFYRADTGEHWRIHHALVTTGSAPHNGTQSATATPATNRTRTVAPTTDSRSATSVEGG